MAHRLREKPLPADVLSNIGATIRRFHNHSVDHVDLNANNILITDTGAVWLVDFDRCTVRSGTGDQWKQDNLNRLRRSLDKLVRLDRVQFADSEWEMLEGGYRHLP